MEEKLGQSDPGAGMVPLGMRVDKAMKCHQGSLYATHREGSNAMQRKGNRDMDREMAAPDQEGEYSWCGGKVSTESLSSLGSAGSQFSLHVCTIMPPPPDPLPLFFQ